MGALKRLYDTGKGSAFIYLIKEAEDAPGIPDRNKIHELPDILTPTTWEYALQEHLADKRGLHFDLRLGDPETGHAHSWAMEARWPKPGERTWVIAQPTHTVPYMDFKGEIGKGYGKGKVSLRSRDKTEIKNSRPGHVSFNVYTGQGPEEYTLHQIDGNKWLLYNRTFTSDKLPSFPDRPKYDSVHIDHVDLDNPDHLISAKVDDASVLYYLPKDRQIRVVSTRKPAKRSQGVIEHTHKIPGLEAEYTPKGLGETLLRGGVYAKVDSKDLAGILNSGVWNSREQQKQKAGLVPLIYDVIKFKGKDVANKPYKEKLEILQQVASQIPVLKLPDMATTKEDKKKLLSSILDRTHPETVEGVVIWNLNKSSPPIKAKKFNDHDVYVREFFPGEGKYRDTGVGGFTYSHEPTGPIVGRIGTGFTDAQRKDMKNNPHKYVGLVARVKAQEIFPSGALRAPSFDSWHLDKNDLESLTKVI